MIMLDKSWQAVTKLGMSIIQMTSKLGMSITKTLVVQEVVHVSGHKEGPSNP